MTNQETQLKELFKAEDAEALFEFFYALSSGERRKLAPRVKAQWKEWETGETWGNRRIDTETHWLLLQIAALFCYKLAEYEKARFFGEKRVLDILLLWSPDWLDQWLADGESRSDLDYDAILQLEQAGRLQASPETIVKYLSYYQAHEPEKNLKHPDTLSKHLPWLFQYPSQIYDVDRFYQARGRKHPEWYDTFRNLIERGDLDRIEILSLALRATHLGFNQTATYWFIDLFLFLKPSVNEMLVLQADYLQSLLCPQTKVQRVALAHLKKIIKHADFQTQTVVAAVAPLFQSSTKAVLKEALSLYQKIAPPAEELRPFMCQQLASGLMTQDAKLQDKLAAFILKYGKVEDEVLAQQLEMLQEYILVSTQQTLQDFMELGEPEALLAEWPVEEIIPPLDPRRALPMPESVEDFVYLAMQALESADISTQLSLPAAVHHWYHRLEGVELSAFGPLVQRACKLIQRRSWQNANSYHIHLIYYTLFVFENLIKRSPKEGKVLQQIIDKAEKKERQANSNHGNAYTPLLNRKAYWQNGERPSITIWKMILDHSLKSLGKKEFVLLSSPSHQAYWLAPEQLIERLLVYQNHKLQPFPLDLEIALYRIPPDKMKDFVALAKAKFNQQWLKILETYWSDLALPIPPLTWEVKLEEKVMNYSLKVGGKPHVFKRVTIAFAGESKVTKSLKERIGQVFQKRGAEPKILSLPKVLGLQASEPPQFYGGEVAFAQSFYPHRLEHFCKNLVSRYIGPGATYPSPEVYDVEIYQSSLQCLLDYLYPMGEMSSLFLAGSFFFGEKSIRQLAAEIWNQKVSQQLLDPKTLGRCIGKLEYYEYGPLKRLTDLLEQNMLRLSTQHNLALIEMLETCCAELHPKPIRNLKRLLEIYLELLIATKRSPKEPKLISQLQGWQSSNSTQKIAKQILAL